MCSLPPAPSSRLSCFAKGLVDKPVEFATNTLVMIVPASNPAHINSVGDITKPGVKLVICNATVPCGDYARTAFKNLGITAAAMKNVVSQTTDVTQTVADVALGQADAGFVYITDAKAAAGKVRVVRLPPAAKPGAKDFIAVVKAGKNQAAAKAFVDARALAQRPGEAEDSRIRQAVSATAGGASRWPWPDGPTRARRCWAGAGAVSLVVLAFLLLPIVALVTYQPLHDLIHGFGTKVATDAVLVSLKTNAIAFALMVGLGTPFAYVLGRSRFPGSQPVSSRSSNSPW